jgi:hypothetical protein
VAPSQHRFVRGLLAAVNGWQPSEIDNLDWEQMVVDFDQALEIRKMMSGSEDD